MLYWTVLPPFPIHFHSFLTHFRWILANSHQLRLISSPHLPTHTHFLLVLRVYSPYTLICLTYLINLRLYVLNAYVLCTLLQTLVYSQSMLLECLTLHSYLLSVPICLYAFMFHRPVSFRCLSQCVLCCFTCLLLGILHILKSQTFTAAFGHPPFNMLSATTKIPFFTSTNFHRI